MAGLKCLCGIVGINVYLCMYLFNKEIAIVFFLTHIFIKNSKVNKFDPFEILCGQIISRDYLSFHQECL